MATLAEKLQTILTNTPEVYKAGYEAGRNSLPTPQWKLVKTINAMDYCESEHEEYSDPIQVGDDIYDEFRFYLWDPDLTHLEGLIGFVRVVVNLPCPAAPTEGEPTDNFTVFASSYMSAGYDGETAYIQAYMSTADTVEPVILTTHIPEGYPGSMTAHCVCFLKQIHSDPEDPDYVEYQMPTEWGIEIYQLEGIEL